MLPLVTYSVRTGTYVSDGDGVIEAAGGAATRLESEAIGALDTLGIITLLLLCEVSILAARILLLLCGIAGIAKVAAEVGADAAEENVAGWGPLWIATRPGSCGRPLETGSSARAGGTSRKQGISPCMSKRGQSSICPLRFVQVLTAF
jgi:hypothetical protein